MVSTEPHGNEVAYSRLHLLLALWNLVMDLRRNSNVIVFNHFKAHTVWIGIMDVRATETELIDLEKNGNGTA